MGRGKATMLRPGPTSTSRDHTRISGEPSVAMPPEDLLVVVPGQTTTSLAATLLGKILPGLGNGTLDVFTRDGCLHHLPHRSVARVLTNRMKHAFIQQELSASANTVLLAGRKHANPIAQLLSNVSLDPGFGVLTQGDFLDVQSLRHSE